MKALLYKDFCILKTNLKPLFFAIPIVIFASHLYSLTSYFTENSAFLSYLMVNLSTLFTLSLVESLIEYDHKSKWNIFSTTLPYSKKDIVSSKYIMSAIIIVATVIIHAVFHISVFCIAGKFDLGVFASGMIFVLFTLLLTNSASLPCMFRFGYTIGSVIGIIIIFTIIFVDVFLLNTVSSLPVYLVLALSATVIFALSWWLSIIFYKRRDQR